MAPEPEDNLPDNMLDNISMRPVVFPDDEAFLIDLYLTTREDDIAMLGLPEAQVRQLFEMQYHAQRMQYEAEYPGAEHVIIVLDETPVGRLMTKPSETKLFGIDLAILPEYRSKGIGEIIMKGLMDKADADGVPFLFSVLKTNYKAIKFYKRLGIVFNGETLTHHLLEWRQGQA